MGTRLAHRAEFAAARTAIAFLSVLGWRSGGRLGELLGHFAFSVLRVRRAVAERQVAFAFPGLSTRETRRIARASYAHMGRSMVETVLLRSRAPEFIHGLGDGVEGWDIVEAALARGRGMILVTGHLGSWELAGSYLAAKGLRMAGVARRMSNPLFDRFVSDTRSRLGIQVIYENEAVRAGPRHLLSGGTLAVLADQGVRGLASSYVPFFGRLARTPRGAAVLSARFRVPVVFGVCLRRPDGKYRFVIESLEPVAAGSDGSEPDALVARYTAALERWVRRAPEQYFWMHRRWRRQPHGAALLDEKQLLQEAQL